MAPNSLTGKLPVSPSQIYGLPAAPEMGKILPVFDELNGTLVISERSFRNEANYLKIR